MIFLLFFISFTYGSAASTLETVANLTTCIENFYIAVYSENYNCTSQYDFTSTNETVNQKSLISGKSCALEILGETCTHSQFDAISSNFESFVKILTVEPKDQNCTNFYYRSNAFKCVGLLRSLRAKMELILQMQPKVNDSRLLNLIDQCENFKSCLNPKCIKTAPTMPCDSLHALNSEFITCSTKLQKNPPTNQQFPCLEDLDLGSKDVLVRVKLYTTHKECTKEIMKESCGDGAIVDFDKNADALTKAYAKKAEKQFG
ncbi:unnamed protein product [Caenorhabditis nigoni]